MPVCLAAELPAPVYCDVAPPAVVVGAILVGAWVILPAVVACVPFIMLDMLADEIVLTDDIPPLVMLSMLPSVGVLTLLVVIEPLISVAAAVIEPMSEAGVALDTIPVSDVWLADESVVPPHGIVTPYFEQKELPHVHAAARISGDFAETW